MNDFLLLIRPIALIFLIFSIIRLAYMILHIVLVLLMYVNKTNTIQMSVKKFALLILYDRITLLSALIWLIVGGIARINGEVSILYILGLLGAALSFFGNGIWQFRLRRDFLKTNIRLISGVKKMLKSKITTLFPVALIIFVSPITDVINHPFTIVLLIIFFILFFWKLYAYGIYIYNELEILEKLEKKDK